MIALIDGDIVCYRCAASAEMDEMATALMRSDLLMKEIMDATGATEFRVFLSGPKESNFRYKVDPQYKANRADVARPIHLDSCKHFLMVHWGAEVCTGYEADDGMGIAQKASGTVICSIDKDMLQVPGQHYNFVKKKFTQVWPDGGLKAFYMQTLIGDRSDGIRGVDGIGPIKAAKILDDRIPEEYYSVCRKLYNDDDRYHSNCKLLWIMRSHDDVWTPPDEEEEPLHTTVWRPA